MWVVATKRPNWRGRAEDVLQDERDAAEKARALETERRLVDAKEDLGRVRQIDPNRRRRDALTRAREAREKSDGPG